MVRGGGADGGGADGGGAWWCVVRGGTWWYGVVRGGSLLSISLVGPGVSLPSGVVLARRGTPLFGPLSIEGPGVRLARPFSGGGVSEQLSCTAIAYTMYGWCIWVARPNYAGI